MEADPGQIVEISLQGYDEAPFAISRLFEDEKRFAVSVKRMGHLTKMLHRCSEGDKVGVRGSYGNSFPLNEWEGKDIYVMGGGIGMAPLRPIIDYMLENRNQYGSLEIIFGARSPELFLYKEDIEDWKKDEEIELHMTIDQPADGWNGNVGFVPDLVDELKIESENTIGVICGPPIMINLTTQTLEELGWEKSDIYTTLERKMQCGIGKCGRCNIKEKMVCKDGPVFRIDQIPETAL